MLVLSPKKSCNNTQILNLSPTQAVPTTALENHSLRHIINLKQLRNMFHTSSNVGTHPYLSDSILMKKGLFSFSSLHRSSSSIHVHMVVRVLESLGTPQRRSHSIRDSCLSSHQSLSDGNTWKG